MLFVYMLYIYTCQCMHLRAWVFNVQQDWKLHIYPAKKLHNNLGFQMYHLLLFLLVWPANHPTIMCVALCHKRMGNYVTGLTVIQQWKIQSNH